MSPPPPAPAPRDISQISLEEWIAAGQACCGLDPPADEPPSPTASTTSEPMQ